MSIVHILFTVFSIRGLHWEKKFDPLVEIDLEYRFTLFESICLPSVAGQSTDNFLWGIIIDQNLPVKYQNRLRNLISKVSNKMILFYTGEIELKDFFWVNELLSGSPEYLILSNIDDDDAIPFNYMEKVQSHVEDLIVENNIPPFKIIGSSNIVQWDLKSSDKYPFGTFSPWHKSKRFSSCGFTIVAKYPDIKVNILGLGHSLATEYVDFNSENKKKNVTTFQNIVKPILLSKYGDILKIDTSKLVHDMSGDVAPVLMLNHFRNNQATRLDEEKPWYRRVYPGQFNDIAPINWELISKNLAQFKHQRRWMFAEKRR